MHGFAHSQIVEQSIHKVKLTDAARTRVGGYSGGMKRCLSVAIALLGDPKLVILDEPVCKFFFLYIHLLNLDMEKVQV